LTKALNPHASLLFIDFLLSQESQRLIMKGGSGRRAKLSAQWSKNSKSLP
jgi:ABC-type Fe3+ transport system substrate-binding protein